MEPHFEYATEIRTKMGMVFQNFNLFPHMTVLENVTCAPINAKAKSRVSLASYLIKLMPIHVRYQGGQQQRVAIELCYDPATSL